MGEGKFEYPLMVQMLSFASSSVEVRLLSPETVNWSIGTSRGMKGTTSFSSVQSLGYSAVVVGSANLAPMLKMARMPLLLFMTEQSLGAATRNQKLPVTMEAVNTMSRRWPMWTFFQPSTSYGTTGTISTAMMVNLWPSRWNARELTTPVLIIRRRYFLPGKRNSA